MGRSESGNVVRRKYMGKEHLLHVDIPKPNPEEIIAPILEERTSRQHAAGR